MSASSTPSSGDNQPSQATDALAWRRHLPALASAAAWDAVSDSLCDADGWPLDDKVYGDGKAKRDAEAWKHAEVFLDHGPEVLAGVRAAADGCPTKDRRWCAPVNTWLTGRTPNGQRQASGCASP